jgi:polyphosphate kinase
MDTYLNSPEFYLNRELSWLRFNSRVLDQANYDDLLPLDKLKFIAIYGTNLDEFYMIRVAGLKSLYKAGIYETSYDKLTPAKQLQEIRAYLRAELPTVENMYLKIVDELKEHDVYIKDYNSLDKAQKDELKEYFFEHIYPIIIPIAVDATHPFPHLNNLSFAIALELRANNGEVKHGLIRIPRVLPRFIKLKNTFIPIESIVEYYTQELFPGFEVVVSAPFRVTRNADLAIEEEEADDFLEILEEGLRTRNKGAIVRLELNGNADESIVAFLSKHLDLQDKDIYYYKHTPLNLGSFWQIVGDKDLAYLRNPSFKPRILPPLDREDIYEAMEREEIMLYHPYESFEPVVKFIQEAANDKDTLAIRMVLYRVGSNSPIVKALIDAVESGKQVTVMVELKARFDEENNLKWARKLESAGAHVVYGIPGLKVHAKIAHVIKHKNGKLKGYLHLATGNYNPTTAKLYTDISFFTTNPKFNSDATKFFHLLTAFATNKKLSHLYMSPTQIKPKLLRLIEKESENGENGHMILKANALVDQDIIRALYKASMKGCKIDLIIRGICCLRCDIEGVSDNIRVHSIIGKYLEHPRIYWFKHNKVKAFISSADLMPRNLDRRIELMVPIESSKLSERIEQILKLQLADNTHRYILTKGYEYERVRPKEGEEPINSQELLEQYVIKASKAATTKKAKHITKLAKKMLKSDSKDKE